MLQQEPEGRKGCVSVKFSAFLSKFFQSLISDKLGRVYINESRVTAPLPKTGKNIA